MAITKKTYDRYPTPYIEEGISYKAFAEDGIEPRIDLYAAGCTQGRTNWNFDGVFSPFWRLYYAPHTGNIVIHEKREYRLTGKNLLVIPRDVLFRCASTGDPNHLFIHFGYGGHGLQLVSQPVSIPVTPALEQQGKQLFHMLPGEARDQHASFHRLMSFLHLAVAELEIEKSSFQEKRIAHVLRHIEAHYERRLANPELATLAGLHPDYFVTWFRKHVGVSPNRYLLSLRIRKAARRLVHTDKTIDMIAEETGFASRHYFSRVFSQQMGVSPAAFRRKQIESGPERKGQER